MKTYDVRTFSGDGYADNITAYLNKKATEGFTLDTLTATNDGEGWIIYNTVMVKDEGPAPTEADTALLTALIAGFQELESMAVRLENLNGINAWNFEKTNAILDMMSVAIEAEGQAK